MGLKYTDQISVSAQLALELNIYNFDATNGWLERWKIRNAIQFKNQHGEKQDADIYDANQ